MQEKAKGFYQCFCRGFRRWMVMVVLSFFVTGLTAPAWAKATDDPAGDEALWEISYFVGEALDMDEEAVFKELKAGKSLQELAQARGVTTQVLVDGLVTAFFEAPDGEEEIYELVEIAAQTLSMDEEALWKALDSGKTLAQIAKEKGVDAQAVVDAVMLAIKTELEAEVTAGEITADQAAQWLAEIKPEIAALMDEALGAEGDESDPYMAKAAALLGMTEADVWTALEKGQTLAELAKSKGLDPQVIVDAVVFEMQSDINAELAAGEITQQEADQWTAGLKAEVTDMVNQPLEEDDAYDEAFDAYMAEPAKLLGMDTDSLWTALESGQTLSELAQAKNVDAGPVYASVMSRLQADIKDLLTVPEP